MRNVDGEDDGVIRLVSGCWAKMLGGLCDEQIDGCRKTDDGNSDATEASRLKALLDVGSLGDRKLTTTLIGSIWEGFERRRQLLLGQFWRFWEVWGISTILRRLRCEGFGGWIIIVRRVGHARLRWGRIRRDRDGLGL